MAALIFGASGAPISGASADEASVNAAAGARAQSSTVGVSSYYGPGFHGLRTADGEIFDRYGISAAHKTLPIPSYARVTNLSNGRSIIVRVNDRGPYVGGRILDVSERVARLLAFNGGLSRVKLDYLGKAGPAGAAEQRALLATLRNGDEPIAVAAAKPKAEEGVTKVARSAPALAYAPLRTSAAAAALDSAVRPAAPVPAAAKSPLGLAASLDASARKLQTALETAQKEVAKGASPFGELVVSPFKPVMQALR